jgi:hypothetical protein
MPPPALKLALYYPYIRIRDVEWLKATLLCFPQVRRIVPDSYMPIDSDEIRVFLNTEGQHGPLLTHSASLMEYPVAMQMGQLGEWMKEHLSELHLRYNVEETQKEFRRDAFQIHKGKISPSIRLMEMLEAEGLAWRSLGPDSYFWISMHPRLGRAVMSTIAAAIAKFDGLAIVTPSTQAHYKISGLEGKQLWESLLQDERAIEQAPDQDSLAETMELVLLSTFDLKALTAADIANLTRSTGGLAGFREKLADLASEIPMIPNAKERMARIEAAADEMRADWQRQKGEWPKHLRDAAFTALDFKLPAEAAMMWGVSHYGQAGMWAAGALGICAIVHAAGRSLKTYREASATPYQYLSEIEEAGATMRSQAIELPKIL